MTCLFFISFSLSAKVLKDEHTVTSSNSYAWKEVCLKMTKRDSPLIDKSSASFLDCMGTKVEIEKFCDEKEAANAFYTRASINEEKRTVECKSGRSVIFKWQCEGDKDAFCKDAETGCFLVQEKLAKRLKMIHSSLIGDGFKKNLNCYFGLKSEKLELSI